MASSHIARITAGGVSDRRIAHSMYGYCTSSAGTITKTVSLYTGSSTTADGTWTAADLFPGLSITVRFQYSNTANNPTLNVNGTGAKPIYLYGTTRVGTHTYDCWRAQSIIDFTYDTSLNSSGCWVMHTEMGRSDNDTYDRITLSTYPIMVNSSVGSDNLIVADSNGRYMQLNTGNSFDITYPVLYTISSMESTGSSYNNCYLTIPFTITTTQSISLTPLKAIYIKGTLSGTSFTPISTSPITQTIPNTEDGYQYYFIGVATASTTNAYLYPDHPIYEYSGGKFHLYGEGGVGVFHGTITKTANTASTISVNHYLNTKNIMVSVVVNDGTNEFLISPTSLSSSLGIAYFIKVVDDNGIELIFNSNETWASLVGTIKVTVITTDKFSIDPSSTNDILIKVN